MSGPAGSVDRKMDLVGNNASGLKTTHRQKVHVTKARAKARRASRSSIGFADSRQTSFPSRRSRRRDACTKISYFGCNEPEKLQKLLDLGVDFILTDRLDVIQAKYKELKNDK